jgi:hypothetical protein
MKLTTHFHLVLRPNSVWSCTSNPPICLHGVVLKFHLLPLPYGLVVLGRLMCIVFHKLVLTEGQYRTHMTVMKFVGDCLW